MKVLLLIFLILGLVDSAYLSYTHYVAHTSPYCPVNSCLPPVELFAPSYILAILGLIWFLVGILLIPIKKTIFIRIWQILGVAGVVFLFSYSLAIQYYCAYCYIAHAFAVVSVLSWRWVK